METFKKKNDIGIDIEYTVVGRFKDNAIYLIYTYFVSADNVVGLRLFVDEYDFNNNFIRSLELDEANEIIDKFNDEIIVFKGV